MITLEIRINTMVKFNKLKLIIADLVSIPAANDNYPNDFLDDYFWQDVLPE